MARRGPEAKIQEAVRDYAKKRGLLPKKLSIPGPMGTAGWPDFMFLPLRGFAYSIFFIEFKAPGAKLTPLQKEIREQIEGRMHHYYVVDDAARGKDIIDAELAGKKWRGRV